MQTFWIWPCALDLAGACSEFGNIGILFRFLMRTVKPRPKLLFHTMSLIRSPPPSLVPSQFPSFLSFQKAATAPPDVFYHRCTHFTP